MVDIEVMAKNGWKKHISDKIPPQSRSFSSKQSWAKKDCHADFAEKNEMSSSASMLLSDVIAIYIYISRRSLCRFGDKSW